MHIMNISVYIIHMSLFMFSALCIHSMTISNAFPQSKFIRFRSESSWCIICYVKVWMQQMKHIREKHILVLRCSLLSDFQRTVHPLHYFVKKDNLYGEKSSPMRILFLRDKKKFGIKEYFFIIKSLDSLAYFFFHCGFGTLISKRSKPDPV